MNKRREWGRADGGSAWGLPVTCYHFADITEGVASRPATKQRLAVAVETRPLLLGSINSAQSIAPGFLASEWSHALRTLIRRGVSKDKIRVPLWRADLAV